MIREIKNYINALPADWSGLFYSDSFIYFYYVDLYDPNNIDVRMDWSPMMNYTNFNRSGDVVILMDIGEDIILTKKDLQDALFHCMERYSYKGDLQ